MNEYQLHRNKGGDYVDKSGNKLDELIGDEEEVVRSIYHSNGVRSVVTRETDGEEQGYDYDFTEEDGLYVCNYCNMFASETVRGIKSHQYQVHLS